MYDKYTDISIYLSYKEIMKKKAIILLSMLSICAISYSASIEENLKSIESKYDSILKKEEEKKLELRSERDKLNEEVANLTKILDRKDEGLEKLRKDSEVRWYRNEYKKILNEYEGYYEGLEKTKEEKEHKIQEINQILDIMEQF